jgi:glutathione S-transferase
MGGLPVDAVFGPIFRDLDVFDTIADFKILHDLPSIARWRVALSQRASVKSAVRDDYAKMLHRFFVMRQSALSRLVV